MIDAVIFYSRQDVCKQCEFWRGACLRGHVLQGPLGCPLKKFDGVDGTGYATDIPVNVPVLPAPGECCGQSGEIKPMTWIEVWRHLYESIQAWQKAGRPLTGPEVFNQRMAKCKACDEYAWFQCKVCKCIAMAKAKLETEDCPRGYWPPVVKG